MNEGTTGQGPKVYTKEEAVNIIEMAIQEVYLMGANDFEIPHLKNLIERLKKGECSPEDALKETASVKNSKQDYH